MRLAAGASRLSGLLIAVAGLTSGYLLWRTWALLRPAAHETADVCSTLFGSSCDAALASRGSWILGIPLAGWGVVVAATLATLLVLGGALGRGFRREAYVGAALLSGVAGIAGLVLGARMVLGTAPLCPLCLLVHGANLALVPVLLTSLGRPPRAVIVSLRRGAAWCAGRSAPEPRAGSWKLVGFLNAALVASTVYQWVFVQTTLRANSAVETLNPEQIIAAWRAIPQQNVPVAPRDPRAGPAAAPAQMVIFSSLQCPGCRRLADEVATLRREFGDRLAIAFKHYPLSTACNDRLQVNKQPRACEFARAAEAAHRQERFWDFHDRLLGIESAGPGMQNLEELARELQLDMEQFTTDRESIEVRSKVAADVALGTKLGIPGTPAVFLNGKPVQPASLEILQILIRHELAHARPSPPIAAPRLDDEINPRGG